MHYIDKLLEEYNTVPNVVKELPGTKIIIPPNFVASQYEDALSYIIQKLQNDPKSKIIYCWPDEGYLIDIIRMMHKLGEILITEHNVSPENFIYVCAASPTQTNIDYYKKYQELFPYLPRHVYCLPTWQHGSSVFYDEEPEPIDHSVEPQREKKFMFLNRGARPHRSIALSELYDRGLLSQCHLSFYDDSVCRTAITELAPNLAPKVISNYDNVFSTMLPVGLTLTPDHHNMYKLTSEDIALHQSSLFSLISETVFCSNIDTLLDASHELLSNALCFPCNLLSEKTWRTIKQKHPFIILGHVNSIKTLRELGFKTFSPYIDESYDQIQNDEERLLAVINEVERLCNMSDEDTKIWLENVHQITKYNFELLTNSNVESFKFESSPKKVYIVHPYGEFYHHVEKIIETNPDSILLWSDVEYDAEGIFRNFLEQLSDYITSNNKPVTILYPGPSRKLTENISLEKTYGYYLINNSMVLSQNSHVDFNNVHLEADKLYTLYCNRGSSERVKIIDAFAREGMLSDGIVTFHGIYNNEQPKWQYHNGSALTDEDNFKIGEFGPGSPQYFPKSFFRGFADVVCESRVDNHEFFTTEKTAKSIAALKPFLALSCQNYHRYLRDEYGIYPYSEIFDYNFDRAHNIDDRIEGIVKNMQRLKTMDKDKVHSRLFDKLVHNKNQFIKYGMIRDNIVPKSLEFVFNEPYELLGDVIATDPWFELIRKNGWLT